MPPGRRVDVVAVRDDGHRCDGGERGRLRLGDEELGDARIGQTHQADLVVQHPGLVRDRLDDVVPIEELERLVVVIGAAGAAGAAHVHADGGVAQHTGDERGRVVRGVTQNREVAAEPLGGVAQDMPGARWAVAGVGDHGRVGAVLGRPGQGDEDGEARAIAGGQVAEPGLQGLGRRAPDRGRGPRSSGPRRLRRPGPARPRPGRCSPGRGRPRGIRGCPRSSVTPVSANTLPSGDTSSRGVSGGACQM